MPESTKVAQRPDIEHIQEQCAITRAHFLDAPHEIPFYPHSAEELCVYVKRLEQALRDVLGQLGQLSHGFPHENAIERIIRETGIKL